MLRNLIKQNRCYRRFDENIEIEADFLFEMINNVRYVSSARNQQILMFKPIRDKDKRESIFPHLQWAGYLKNWNGPVKGERPTAYIIVGFNKNRLKFKDNWAYTDLGIATQTLLLQAVENGLGGCHIAAFNKKKISDIIECPDYIDLQIVLALGKPIQKVEIVELNEAQGIEYYEKNEVHYVPKRRIDDILF